MHVYHTEFKRNFSHILGVITCKQVDMTGEICAFLRTAPKIRTTNCRINWRCRRSQHTGVKTKLSLCLT